MNNIALEIIKKISDNGFEAYIIGGYPRDFYLGRINDDIDICTSAKYSDLVKLFGDIENNRYGSYILNYSGYSFEVTTFRRDLRYVNNRSPRKVIYTRSLKKDLKRRDFTINTLCIAPDGSFVDLMNARLDINHRIIKLIGSSKKISDDSLRILRAIRFATVMDFNIDNKLSKAIIKYKDNLSNLSFDRKKQELEKIFSSHNCLYGINLIVFYGLDKYLKIDLRDVVIVDDLCGIWAQILVDDSYNFTKREKFKISKIRECMNIPFELYDLYKYGKDVFRVVSKIKNDGLDIDSMYDSFPIKDRDDVAVSFFDICDVVSVNNSMINDIYVDIEKKIIYNELANDKEILLKYISENY